MVSVFPAAMVMLPVTRMREFVGQTAPAGKIPETFDQVVLESMLIALFVESVLMTAS